MNNSGGPLDDQISYTNGWPQQKLSKFGFHTHTTAFWPVEQSSMLCSKLDSPVARQNFSLLLLRMIVKLAYWNRMHWESNGSIILSRSPTAPCSYHTEKLCRNWLIVFAFLVQNWVNSRRAQWSHTNQPPKRPQICCKHVSTSALWLGHTHRRYRWPSRTTSHVLHYTSHDLTFTLHCL